MNQNPVNLQGAIDEISIPNSSANSVANISTNAKKLEKTKNKRKGSQELPSSNKSPKYSKLTKPQVAQNCETAAALARKRKLNSKESYPQNKKEKRENLDSDIYDNGQLIWKGNYVFNSSKITNLKI